MALSLDSNSSTVIVFPDIVVDPDVLVAQATLVQSQLENANERFIAGRFELLQNWLQPVSTLILWSVFRIRDDSIDLLLAEDSAELRSQLSNPDFSIDNLSDQLQSPLLPIAGPVKLKTVAIAKPWGQEIWYTGVEKRGVAEVTDGRYSIPLPWFQAALHATYFNTSDDVVLLKILDPLPDEVYGDLYFELHEKKQEVYVVTSLDENAWPDGLGEIRMGFDQSRLSEYESDARFLAAYRTAVADYKGVRQTIDDKFDELRCTEGIPLDKPVSAAFMKRWQLGLPSELIEREKQLRKNMESFTATLPLRVGDVVKIPCLMPHALQHGVRTIEFQTPVYERKIVSFGQKVLTQSDWDTDEALQLVDPAVSYSAKFDLMQQRDGLTVEKIVQFDDFQVFRTRLGKDNPYALQSGNTYQIVMVVSGGLQIGDDFILEAEQACLLPQGRTAQVRALLDETLFLITLPIVAYSQ